MSTPSEQLAGNIMATVSTADAVLAHFEHALVQAGFADGAESYTRLADTLLGQRVWVEASGMAADARFRAVGARARSIHALLLPYVEAFHRLTALAAPSLLGETDELEPDAATVDPAEARVLETLDAATRPLSTTALRAAVGLPKADLAAALDRLAERGCIERRQASGRELIKRSTKP
jgi:hypothetical protein